MQLFGAGVRVAFILECTQTQFRLQSPNLCGCDHHLRTPFRSIQCPPRRHAHWATLGTVISTHRPVHARSTILDTMQRWLSRRALLLHFEFLLVVAGCAAATWWQARRALGGNGLSWFYTFEWPILAGIAIAAWWHLIHEDPTQRAAEEGKSARFDRADG